MTRLPNRLQSIALLILWFTVGPGGLHGVARAEDEPRPEDVDVDTAVKLGIEKLAEAQQFIEDEDILKAVHRIKWAELYLKRAPEDHAEAVYGRGCARVLMGYALSLNGQTKQTMTWYIEASKHFERLTGDKALANLRHAIEKTAEAATSIHAYEQALLSLQNIYQIDLQKKSNNDELVKDLNNIAVILKRLGRLGEADRNLEFAEDLIAKGGVTPDQQARHYLHRGLISNGLQIPRAAVQHFEKSLQLLKSQPDTEIRQSECLIDLANTLRDSGHREDAHKRLQEALKLVRKHPEAKATALSLELQIAINSDEHEKDPKAYIARLQAIEEKVRSIPGTEKIRMVCLMNISTSMKKMGQIDQAIASMNSVLELLPKLVDPYAYSKEIHKNLGILWAIKNKPNIANKHFLKSLSYVISRLVADLPGMIDQSKYISISSSHIPLTESIHTLCFEHPSGDGIQGFQATLWTKALYSEVCRWEQPMLHHALTPEQQSRVAHYQELRRKVSRRALENREGFDDDDTRGTQLTELANELRQVELSLRRDPEVYRKEFRFTHTPARNVVSRLGPGQILLEFVVYDPPSSEFSKDEWPQYGVYVVNGSDGSIRAVSLGPTERIDDAILAYLDTHREQLFRNANDERILRQRGVAIREIVLDPILKSLKGISRIYVAPDGLVGLFPFEVLPVETTRYLVEETQVVYLMTGRDLARKTPAQLGQRPQACWLVGDPSYDASTDQRIAMFQKASPSNMGTAPKSQTVNGDTPREWDRLPNTRSAISSIAAVTRKAKLPTHVLLDASASEESLWQIRSPLMLVLATHGQYLKKPPGSHFRFESVIGEAGRINEDFFETANPLQRSMLILAGANRPKHQVDCYLVDDRLVPKDQMEEDPRPRTPAESIQRELGDGQLTAYEVWDMNLQGTELVVLLACESGLGVTQQGETSPGLRQPKGEGVAGLRQAFMVAGAQSLIMSMWKVSEEDSIQQIVTFFDGWLFGDKTRYEAFYAAQLKALNDARTKHGNTHPFWWAGFVYFGQPTDRGF